MTQILTTVVSDSRIVEPKARRRLRPKGGARRGVLGMETSYPG